MRPYKNYDQHLLESLKDPTEAAAYLNAAMEENDSDLVLVALGYVARAHGITALAQRSAIHRVSLHKMLSKRGNPEFNSLIRIVKAAGLRLSFQAEKIAA
jgi:probable addiction module antidote protein